MADGTKIEWTDATWNPITGCSIASAGCRRCYAMLLAGTRMQHHPSRAGLTHLVNGNHVWTGEVRFNDGSDGTPNWLDQPLAWAKARMIFVNAHGDTFHENVPWAWVDKIMARAALAPQHVFQVLTKRSARMREYLNHPETPARIHAELMAWGGSSAKDAGRRARAAWRLEEWPLANVWAGVSVEDQPNADVRVPDLLATNAAVRWLSAEPLLGPIDLRTIVLRRDGGTPTELSNHLGDYVQPLRGNFTDSPRINWVVAGGESDKGPRARPMHPAWVRDLRDQCDAAGVAFLFKQWGDWREAQPGDVFDTSKGRMGKPAAFIVNPEDGTVHCFLPDHAAPAWRVMVQVGKSAAGRLLDGVEHNGLPA